VLASSGGDFVGVHGLLRSVWEPSSYVNHRRDVPSNLVKQHCRENLVDCGAEWL
jgi:hypothetical protein